MVSAVYCLDNDIIFKLATCSLFEKTLETFNVKTNQVKILETFIYKFPKKSNRKRDKNPVSYNVEAALKIAKDCNKLSEIDVNRDYSILLQTIEEIDTGEAILLSYASYLNQQGNSSYLLTGDKRCLKALNNPKINNIIQPLAGKIWCLEQLILKDIEVYGFACIQQKIYPARACDTNLKNIFGYSIESPENEVIKALTSEIRGLKQETGNLLYPYPK